MIPDVLQRFMVKCRPRSKGENVVFLSLLGVFVCFYSTADC